MAKALSLLDQSSDSEVEFTINENYAEKYDSWRNKEEMQKLKDLSKDISDTSSESEEEDDPVIEKDFLKTLSLIKSKDPVIYNENVEFFKEEDIPKKPKVKKEKPMFMKDYERKVVLERNGQFSDEDAPPPKPSVKEELDEIANSLKAAVDSDDESDETQGSEVGGLFQVRTKTVKEEEDEEEEYLQWLKGQKKKVGRDTEKDLSFLHGYWNDSNLDEGEKFLRDYLLNQKFVDKGKSDGVPSYGEITEDAETLREEEEILQQQEQFEHKYNFRFEEPDLEFIKRYPRTVGDSLRRVDNKRKLKRDDYAERKKREKDQKREELKRLKALKRKEIEEKFFKLKEASGKEEINFDEDDIESDFDPDKHDEKMKELFNDDYYAVEEEQKPEFIHDDEIDDEDWDHWTRDQTSLKTSVKDLTQREDKESSADEDEGAADRKAEFEQEMIDSSRAGRRKGRKKSLFAKIVSQPKPLYDPDGKSFEDYLDEYYNLDYEDVIGDQPVRFRYRKVIPNDFGLTPDEILAANDKELNRWCSVKKTCQYRRDEEELYDVQAFKKKAQNAAVKEKILASVYAPQEDEDALNNDPKEAVSNVKRKRKRSKKRKAGNDSIHEEQGNSSQDDAVSPVKDNEDLDSTNDLSERKKKRRKKNKKSDEISHDASENNDAESSFVEQENTILSSKESMECLDSSNVCDDNLPTKKRKKRKNKANLDTESSLQIPDTSENKVKENGKKKDPSFHVPESSVGGNEQSGSSKKSKRKRKRNKTFDGGKPQHSDKRLAVSDSRLAAFGINPKKFKNSIIYSKK